MIFFVFFAGFRENNGAKFVNRKIFFVSLQWISGEERHLSISRLEEEHFK